MSLSTCRNARQASPDTRAVSKLTCRRCGSAKGAGISWRRPGTPDLLLRCCEPCLLHLLNLSGPAWRMLWAFREVELASLEWAHAHRANSKLPPSIPLT
jgi:hypothetical protein